MTQNANRHAIIGNTLPSYSIAHNPYGDEPEVAGFCVSCFDPVTGEHTLEGNLCDTFAEAQQELANLLAR